MIQSHQTKKRNRSKPTKMSNVTRLSLQRTVDLTIPLILMKPTMLLPISRLPRRCEKIVPIAKTRTICWPLNSITIKWSLFHFRVKLRPQGLVKSRTVVRFACVPLKQARKSRIRPIQTAAMSFTTIASSTGTTQSEERRNGGAKRTIPT